MDLAPPQLEQLHKGFEALNNPDTSKRRQPASTPASSPRKRGTRR